MAAFRVIEWRSRDYFKSTANNTLVYSPIIKAQRCIGADYRRYMLG